MSVKKGLLSAVGLALLALGIQLPIQAQTLSDAPTPEKSAAYSVPLDEVVPTDFTAEQFSETAYEVSVDEVSTEEVTAADEVSTEEATAADLTYPTAEETELAQSRRRSRRTARSAPAFIGIGGDIGTIDDLSFAVISKVSLSQQVAIRPSVIFSDDLAVLVPVTYEFSRFNTEAGQFQVRPYAGVGASYLDEDDSSEIGLLLAGGIDVPISQRFTLNAQANYAGIFSDNENFGATVGVGYNFSGLGL